MKIVFGKEGKAFDIVNKHLKRSASKLGSISLKRTRDKEAVAWAFRVWDELNMQFEKGGINDRRELLGTYRGCKMKKGANPVEYLTEMETIRNKLKGCSHEITDENFIYDILTGLTGDYADVGRDIEEEMEKGA